MNVGMMLAMMGAVAGGTTDKRPITLVTETTATGTTVQVVGQTGDALQAAYRLEVSSGTTGTTRSVQSGTARMEPGQRVVLLTAHLGGNAGAKWKARLVVRPVNGVEYEIVEQAE